MTHHAPNTISAILDIHAAVHGHIFDAVEDIPASRMTEQPGSIVNHPAWTLSHLNAYTGVLLSLLGDPDAPDADSELKRFGYGTTPVADPASYATKRELLDRFKERNARAAALVAEKHADSFSRPAPEKFRSWSPTIAHIAITLLIAHPPHHLGQLNQWRRAAGLAPRS